MKFPMADRDTIFALASGTVQAGVAVLRISGPESFKCLNSLIKTKVTKPRFLELRTLYDQDANVLDKALVAVFNEGASFTGEQSAEIHCHGSRAVITKLLDVLGEFEGCRLAKPGEFTRRAFENGRIDLIEAEGLADLVSAETELQRRQAITAFTGALSDQASMWREELIEALALLEVTIDWSDEDVPEDVTNEVCEVLNRLRAAMAEVLLASASSEQVRDGFEIAFVGAPNTGKSTLLNVLAGRDAAITSEVEGTTRDIIELRYDLEGIPVCFLDMAGIRTSSDFVEQVGIERARERASRASLRVFMNCANVASSGETDDLRRDGDISLWMKADLSSGPGDVEVSAHDKSGIDSFLALLKTRLQPRSFSDAIVSSKRQKESISGAISAIERAKLQLDKSQLEISVEELRTASRHMEALFGRVCTEDVLGKVFSTFCLGK